MIYKFKNFQHPRAQPCDGPLSLSENLLISVLLNQFLVFQRYDYSRFNNNEIIYFKFDLKINFILKFLFFNLFFKFILDLPIQLNVLVA